MKTANPTPWALAPLAEAIAGMKKRRAEATSADEFDGAYKRWRTAFDGSFSRVCR